MVGGAVRDSLARRALYRVRIGRSQDSGSRASGAATGARLADILWRFTRDVMGYALRAEAWALPIDDRFPSFDVFSPAREPALG